jgi:hypothetical protein
MWTTTKSLKSADPTERGDVRHVSLAPDRAADQLGAHLPRRIRVVSVHHLVVGPELVPGLAEEPAERLPVPHLFTGPTREEGRDVRVEASPGREQIPKEHRRVGLDVHHVGQASSVVLGQRRLVDQVPLDARQIHALRRT